MGEAELGDIQRLIPWHWAGWLCQDCPLVPPRTAPAFGDGSITAPPLSAL